MLDTIVENGSKVLANTFHGKKEVIIGGNYKAYKDLEGLDSIGYQAACASNPCLQYDLDHDDVVAVIG